MFVGVARFVLQIPGARSLKDRRRVVRAFKDRVRARLPVSVAEVGNVELYQVATLGLSVTSNDPGRCREILGQARSMAASIGDAVLADAAVEVIPFGAEGGGVQGGIEAGIDSSDWDDWEDQPLDEGQR